MTKQIFINLPVADIAKSIAFYEAIGCARDERFGEGAGAMVWNDTVTFMLSSRESFGSLTPKAIADTKTTAEVLFALSLDSREAVDAIAAAALAAGGSEAHGAEDEGFMYSRGFYDPDGHGFGPFHMDMAAMPAQHEAA
jgi:predicted lactoylglutathione lyase